MKLEEIEKIINLGIMANGGEVHNKHWCHCDLSVNYYCEYCATFRALETSKNLFTKLLLLKSAIEKHIVEVDKLMKTPANRDRGMKLAELVGDLQKAGKEDL